MRTFEVAQNIRTYILATTAEVMNYTSWPDAFAAQQIRELPERLKRADWYSPVNPADLTKTEMQALGFGCWSKENPMFLIPLWLFPFLADEIKCECIDGSVGVLRKEDMSNDNRYGNLAYGVIPKIENQSS